MPDRNNLPVYIIPSAATNEITSMVNRSVENVRNCVQAAKSFIEKISQGEKILLARISSMGNIEDSNKLLKKFADTIVQINTKTSDINELVSKTELLSLKRFHRICTSRRTRQRFCCGRRKSGGPVKSSFMSISADIENLFSFVQGIEEASQEQEIGIR